jgi:uncharacterized protein GlcG (DUF336 family)
MVVQPKLRGLWLLAAALAAAPVTAQDVISLKGMSMELAGDIARGAVLACREMGYQVSAVVLDRGGAPQAVMRDTLASRFTIDIAQRKANAVVLSGVGTGEFLANRPDLTPVLNHMEDLLILEGGLPVRTAGTLIGAIGVSGAPGGNIDVRCAQAGLDAVAERLEFAE